MALISSTMDCITTRKKMRKTFLVSFAIFFVLFLVAGAALNLFPSTIEQTKTLEQFEQLVGAEEYAELTAEYKIKFISHYHEDGEIIPKRKEIRIKESTEKRMLVALCHEYGHYIALKNNLANDARYLQMFKEKEPIFYGNYEMTEYAYSDIDEFCASYVGMWIFNNQKEPA